MNKIKVALLMGGPSSEYEVSINSGKTMAEHLDKTAFDLTVVHISKQNKWSIADGQALEMEDALNSLKHNDALLLGLHGTFGEDGVLQELLEKRGIRYTGSSSVVSAVVMSKNKTNLIYDNSGLRVPKWKLFHISDKPLHDIIQSEFELPIVVKPDREGSSVGVSIVKHPEQLAAAIDGAFALCDELIVQNYISGREVSCGVLEDPETGELLALPPTELIPDHSEFFDYEAKYTVDGALEITPPDMTTQQITAIQALAVEAHKILECRGYSRTDLFVCGDEMYVIETNTLPGMTMTSILPRQAIAAGITMTQVLSGLINCALKK